MLLRQFHEYIKQTLNSKLGLETELVHSADLYQSSPQSAKTPFQM